MKRLTQSELEALTKSIDFRTGWPVDGTAPVETSFNAQVVDLRLLPAEQALPEEKIRFRVHCREHMAALEYREDTVDPINSYIDCRHWDCKHKFFIRDLPTLTDAQVDGLCYTSLIEDEDKSWPLKIVDQTDGKRLFGAIRPCSREELVVARIKRMFTIRGYRLP